VAGIVVDSELGALELFRQTGQTHANGMEVQAEMMGVAACRF
jgi:hypothetical protein